jgi:hypothetical protein
MPGRLLMPAPVEDPNPAAGVTMKKTRTMR